MHTTLTRDIGVVSSKSSVTKSQTPRLTGSRVDPGKLLEFWENSKSCWNLGNNPRSACMFEWGHHTCYRAASDAQKENAKHKCQKNIRTRLEIKLSSTINFENIIWPSNPSNSRKSYLWPRSPTSVFKFQELIIVTPVSNPVYKFQEIAIATPVSNPVYTNSRKS